MEAVPLQFSVGMREKHYYKFKVTPDISITEVRIQVNPIHGDPDVFVSRTEEFPNSDNSEEQGFRSGAVPEQVSFFNKDYNLEGEYYIAI